MLMLEWVNEKRVKGHIIMNLNAKEWEVGKGSLLCTMYYVPPPLLKMSKNNQTKWLRSDFPSLSQRFF